MPTMEVVPLTAAIGARLEIVDVRSADDTQIEAIKEAVYEHLVVFIRDQDLSEEDQLAFASRFGKVSTFPVAALLGATAPTVGNIEDTADSPPDADDWHTDVTWVAEPPSMAFLNARIIPTVGGDTMWTSLYAAYDLLSPPMQRMCEGLSAYHWFGERFAEAVGRRSSEIIDRLREAHPYPGVVHPLVRTHPVTGRKALFLSGFMHSIVGMHPDESEVLLAHLQSLLQVPTLQCRWAWRPNDLAIWDERATNHRALSDHYPAHRLMRRCTIDGERPFFAGTSGSEEREPVTATAG